MSLRILKAGPQSLLQDKGRRTCQHLGLCQSGALDTHAYSWANYLLGNDAAAACIEITLGPFIAEFQATTMIALCGADMLAHLNDKEIAMWQSHRVEKGATLTLRPGKSGLRTYLAVKGGFEGTVFYHSRSEVPREKLLPLHIQEKRTVSYTPFDAHSQRITGVPERYIPDYLSPLTLRCYPGYQYSEFSDAARHQFVNQSFRITPRADRMGYRLQGDPIPWEKGGIVSEGIALGSVQIPPDGQPIVLLNDRQTLGGYPKIACVNEMDCSQLAQRRPGQEVNFAFIEIPDKKQSWMLAKNR